MYYSRSKTIVHEKMAMIVSDAIIQLVTDFEGM